MFVSNHNVPLNLRSYLSDQKQEVAAVLCKYSRMATTHIHSTRTNAQLVDHFGAHRRVCGERNYTHHLNRSNADCRRQAAFLPHSVRWGWRSCGKVHTPDTNIKLQMCSFLWGEGSVCETLMFWWCSASCSCTISQCWWVPQQHVPVRYGSVSRAVQNPEFIAIA